MNINNRLGRKILSHVVSLSVVTLLACVAALPVEKPSHARNVVLRGVITGSGSNHVVLRQTDGTTSQIWLDKNTTVLRDGPEFSFANMHLISTSVSELRVGDRIEVVAINQGRRYVGRIITQLNPAIPGQWVTAAVKPGRIGR